MARLVHDIADAIANVIKYPDFVASNPLLQERLSKHRAWYAVKVEGRWHFGPSKFVGYLWESASEYVDLAREHSGSDTEKVIQSWSAEVNPSTNLGRVLNKELAAFLSEFKKTPSVGSRIRVLEGCENEFDDSAENLDLIGLLLAVTNRLPSYDRQTVRSGIRV